MHENWIFQFFFTSRSSTVLHIYIFNSETKTREKFNNPAIPFKFLLLREKQFRKKLSNLFLFLKIVFFIVRFSTDACSDKSFFSTYIPLTTKHCKSLCKILRMSVLCWILYAHIIVLFSVYLFPMFVYNRLVILGTSGT